MPVTCMPSSAGRRVAASVELLQRSPYVHLPSGLHEHAQPLYMALKRQVYAS